MYCYHFYQNDNISKYKLTRDGIIYQADTYWKKDIRYIHKSQVTTNSPGNVFFTCWSNLH